LQIHFCRDKHGVTNIDNHFQMNTTWRILHGTKAN
jgi:hypothetical protein